MKKVLQRYFWIVLLLPSLWVLFLTVAEDKRLTVVPYSITTDKLTQPVRIVMISDLHSGFYGERQEDLALAIAHQNPDLILMTGDIADDDIPHKGTIELLERVAPAYPCYYVTGNHEFRSGEVEKIKAMFRNYGVTVMEGDSALLPFGESAIYLCGVDDPDGGEEKFTTQLESAEISRYPEHYTILLSHRPERIARYVSYGPDLVLSGHAHGGQWRIPGLQGGFIAPHQGFFPKYAGGRYEVEEATMIVSRGLALESTRVPRLFNPPELVVIDLLPAVGDEAAAP